MCNVVQDMFFFCSVLVLVFVVLFDVLFVEVGMFHVLSFSYQMKYNRLFGCLDLVCCLFILLLFFGNSRLFWFVLTYLETNLKPWKKKLKTKNAQKSPKSIVQ